MGNSFRSQPMPARYGEAKTPVTEDVLQIGLIFAVGIIAASFILIIPGIRGKERLWACIRVFVALWIGAILLVCNFGSWYADSICTTTQYKAHTKPNTPQLIQAEVGISIGLRGINITLKEMDGGCGAEDYERPFPGEEIDYVESFRWAPGWDQGRRDFGIYGGQYRQTFRAAQYRGMPYPILWVAETFLFDGEEYLWYRKFRVTGWLTHIWMWTAFATYLLSIIMFISNVRQGAYFMFLTGALMCLACLTYGVGVQNKPPLVVHFPDGILRPTFNYAFYLTGATGVLTIIGAFVIVLMDTLYPRRIAAFFHHALTSEDTTFTGILDEEELGGRRGSRKPSMAYSEGSRKFSLAGLEGKVRRARTLSESTHGSIRSAGGRSDVLPRKKSTVSTRSTSIISGHSEAVVERRGVGKIGLDEHGSVIKKQSSIEQKQSIVEAFIEKSITEKQQSIEKMPQALVEKHTESIMKKQRTDVRKLSATTKQESDLEPGTIQKQVSFKQKQHVAFKQGPAASEKQQLDDIPQQQSIHQQQQRRRQWQQQQHKQSSMEKQHSTDLQQHVVEKQQSVEVAITVAGQSSAEKGFKQHVGKQSSAEKQRKQQGPKLQRSVEVELELAPVKGHTPVQV